MSNAKVRRLKLAEVRGRSPKAVSRQGKAAEAEKRTLLTDGEKVQMAVMLEKLQIVETQAKQVRLGLSELITSIVRQRGLDPMKFGVNLGAGRILPIGKDGQGQEPPKAEAKVEAEEEAEKEETPEG